MITQIINALLTNPELRTAEGLNEIAAQEVSAGAPWRTGNS